MRAAFSAALLAVLTSAGVFAQGVTVVGQTPLPAISTTTYSATTCAQLAGVLSDETGTGACVFATSPALTTPNLGTPSAVTLTNATGLPVSTGISGLGSGVATFLGTPSSANLAAAVTGETGTGAAVFGTAPTFITSIEAPVLFGGNATTSTLLFKPTIGVAADGADIKFNTGNNGAIEAMTIDHLGNVGIGTAAPDAKLDVVGSGFTFRVHPATDENLFVYGKNNLATGILLDSLNDAKNAINGMEFRASVYSFGTGNVGVGTTDPQSKLHVADGSIQGNEIAEPSAPAANGFKLFAKDNGSGKTQLCVIFSSGASQCFATQP